MRTVLLVPRRPDHGPRDAAWAWCRARWERDLPHLPIYEGEHLDGPFSRSAGINTAARLAGNWDLAIVIDADIFIRASQVRQAIARAAQTGQVTWAHRRWRGLHEADTTRLLKQRVNFGAELDHEDMDLLVERTNPLSWSCCVVIPRPIWDDMGGFDERFRGWGFEDMAFQSLVCGLYGYQRIEGDVYHLWHPRSEERIVKGQPGSTASPEYTANARLGRRYMVAVRRDHPGAVGETDSERDIANLTLDDQKLEAQTGRLPEWAEWWPTLEELRDGAKIAGRTVTVIVHTDGRREYIRRAIPSLLKHVHGNIVRRVIYDDSGDPDYKAWLSEQFGPMGFYIAGPAERLGYSGSMQSMWKYLRRRHAGVNYIFQAEDDFIYQRDVDLNALIEVLADHPYLSQVALLRDAYYPRELAAGSIIAEHPEAYEQRKLNGYAWNEHRLYFTANPSLFRQSLTVTSVWPIALSSEKVYTDLLNRDPANRFALWGEGEAWISHIGAERAPDATGY